MNKCPCGNNAHKKIWGEPICRACEWQDFGKIGHESKAMDKYELIRLLERGPMTTTELMVALKVVQNRLQWILTSLQEVGRINVMKFGNERIVSLV